MDRGNGGVCGGRAALAATSWRGGDSSGGDNFELAIAPPAGAEFQVDQPRQRDRFARWHEGRVRRRDTEGHDVVGAVAGCRRWSVHFGNGGRVDVWSPDGKRLGFSPTRRCASWTLAADCRKPSRTPRWPRRLMDGGRLDPLHADRRHHGSQGRGDWRRRDATHEARHDTRRKRALLAGPPAGTVLLYFARSTRVENSGIYLARIDGRAPPVRLVGSLARPPGWPAIDRRARTLLWVRDGDLLGQPFDIDAGVLRGEAATIAQGDGSRRASA